MENPPLEKIIKRLEKLDIREWKYEYYSYGYQFVARTNGLVIELRDKEDCLKVTSDYGHKSMVYEPTNKAEKDMLKKFCEKITKTYEGHIEKELQDRITNFLSD